MFKYTFIALGVFFIVGPTPDSKIKIRGATTKVEHRIGHAFIRWFEPHKGQGGSRIGSRFAGQILYFKLLQYLRVMFDQGGREAALQASAEAGQNAVFYVQRIFDRKAQIIFEEYATFAPINCHAQVPGIEFNRVEWIGSIYFQRLPSYRIALGMGNQLNFFAFTAG